MLLYIVEVVVSVVVVVGVVVSTFSLMSRQLGDGCRGGIDKTAYSTYKSINQQYVYSTNTQASKHIISYRSYI